MVAGNGEAEHGGGTGATPLEERVRRLEKDLEELREQVRTHAQAQTQVRASAETQTGARVETSGKAAALTAERPAQREVASSPFAEATRNPVRRRGGDAREGGPLFRLFPDGLPPATWWVARAGVVLLLVGVSFLLRMGVEQGWLTPAVRVAGGVIIGVALSAFGLGARTSRPAYSQVLVGGGVVAFYLSAFGAWSVWQLVPYGAAFAFCVLTTAFAFAAAVRLSADWLALLGVVGGYVTPFMLLSPHSNVPALIAYSLLLLGGYLMVYVLRGWRSVYVAAIFGVWAILAVSDLGARTYTTSIEAVLPTDAAWSVSTGALVAWLTILFLTSARRYPLASASASARARTDVTVSVSSENGRGASGVLMEAAATSVAPLVALVFAWSAWPSENLSGVHLAALAVAMAFVHLAAYAVVANKVLSSSSSVAHAPREQQGNAGEQAYGTFFEAFASTGLLEDRSAETSRESYGESSRESNISLALRYARAQAFVTVVLLTLAVVFLLDGVVLASALAVEGALLAYLVCTSGSDDAAMRLAGRRLIAAKSWLLLAFAALYSLGTVAWRATNPFGMTDMSSDTAYLPFLNGDAISLLVVVASLFFVGRIGEWADASPWRGVAVVSRLLGHLLLSLGIVSEFVRSDVPSGASFAFLALYALVLAFARFFSERNLSTTGGSFVPSWVASWLDVGAVLCVVAPWLWSRLDTAGTWTGYPSAASQTLSTPGAHFANLVGVLVLFAIAGLLFLWGNARRGASTAWEQESLLPSAAVLLLAASTFFALCWTWTVFDMLSGGGALVSVAWGVLSVVLLAGPALLLSPSSRETGSAGLVYWSSKVGYVVLALVVAKLFLYDLAAVEPILRILLFCGFGAAFLLAAYLFGGERSRTRSDT